MTVGSTWRLRVLQSPLWRRGLSGIFWSLGGSVVARLLTLLASFIVSRQLGTEGFGELGIVQSTIAMLGELSGAGIGLAATKFVAEYRDSDPDKAMQILSQNILLALSVGLVMAIGLKIFAVEIAGHLLGRERLAGLLEWGALLLFFSTLCGGMLGALTGFEQFRKLAIINLCNGVCSLSLQGVLVYHFGINGVIAALAITTCLTFLLASAGVRQTLADSGLSFKFRVSPGNLKYFYKFNLPALMSAIMVVPVNWACNLILVRQAGGFAEMGVFNAANQWRMALLFIPITIGSVVLPILSSMVGANDISRYRKVVIYNVLINLCVSLAIIVIVFFSSKFIMEKYGEGFVAGEETLRVLICVAGLMAINNVIGNAITSTGALWMGFGLNLVWASTMLISAVFFVRSHGALGLAYTNLVAYGLHTVWQFMFLEWRLRHGLISRS